MSCTSAFSLQGPYIPHKHHCLSRLAISIHECIRFLEKNPAKGTRQGNRHSTQVLLNYCWTWGIAWPFFNWWPAAKRFRLQNESIRGKKEGNHLVIATIPMAATDGPTVVLVKTRQFANAFPIQSWKTEFDLSPISLPPSNALCGTSYAIFPNHFFHTLFHNITFTPYHIFR